MTRYFPSNLSQLIRNKRVCFVSLINSVAQCLFIASSQNIMLVILAFSCASRCFEDKKNKHRVNETTKQIKRDREFYNIEQQQHQNCQTATEHSKGRIPSAAPRQTRRTRSIVTTEPSDERRGMLNTSSCKLSFLFLSSKTKVF